MIEIEITIPDNWHCHLRQRVMLVWMVKMSIESGFRGRVLDMPNKKPDPILEYEGVERYCRETQIALSLHKPEKRFTLVSTIQLTEQTTGVALRRAAQRGVRVVKSYPRFVTTNSELGIENYANLHPKFEVMEECGIVWSSHCEHPSYEVEGLHKEARFIEILECVRKRFPRLKIMVEHATTEIMLQWVLSQDPRYVRATLTAHHPFLTLDDVLGYSRRSKGLMCMHHGCKPQPKHRSDTVAIQAAITSGDPHFVYGGDDAAHLKQDKYLGACGVFNTTVALPLLIQLFEERGALCHLDNFLSQYGAEFYGFERNEGKLTFVKEPWTVPDEYPVPGTGDSVVPFLAGTEMLWKLRESPEDSPLGK
jgi:dihydroorotase